LVDDEAIHQNGAKFKKKTFPISPSLPHLYFFGCARLFFGIINFNHIPKAHNSGKERFY
jgi:hypothetical protein